MPSHSPADLIALRRAHLNPALSLAYRMPLKIVRGDGACLYDEAGRGYLDLVNNVCHVGHCHPDVVAAGQRQMALLNTNTRYLHDGLVDYAQALLATFPPELCVLFLTNSGTEANDLALRLARAHSGARDVVVLDHAYHGHSPSMIELSPYKFNGRGGQGRADHVQVVPMPDAYRESAGPAGQHARPHHPLAMARALEAIHARGSSLAAFFCESMPGCGGQVELPEGFLASSYAQVRAAGGVCVADEVQTGFGRVGSHWWAFQRQGVVPDIVTLGKPMGNGHPVGAVVARREVAASFATGMEYFNTYAGNPVSCAVAQAVLAVIEREDLRRNATVVGTRLLDGLRRLQQQHALIGDVRGAGLFIGAELVLDRATRVPATREAGEVVERLIGHGILLSTDGPRDNVLKIKPPMVISTAQADHFLAALDEVLASL